MLVSAPYVILCYIQLIVVDAASFPVALFIIGVVPFKVISRTAARWERSVAICKIMFTGRNRFSSTILDKDGIDVRRAIQSYLINAYHTTYESNIDARKD